MALSMIKAFFPQKASSQSAVAEVESLLTKMKNTSPDWFIANQIGAALCEPAPEGDAAVALAKAVRELRVSLPKDTGAPESPSTPNKSKQPLGAEGQNCQTTPPSVTITTSNNAASSPSQLANLNVRAADFVPRAISSSLDLPSSPVPKKVLSVSANEFVPHLPASSHAGDDAAADAEAGTSTATEQDIDVAASYYASASYALHDAYTAGYSMTVDEHGGYYGPDGAYYVVTALQPTATASSGGAAAVAAAADCALASDPASSHCATASSSSGAVSENGDATTTGIKQGVNLSIGSIQQDPIQADAAPASTDGIFYGPDGVAYSSHYVYAQYEAYYAQYYGSAWDSSVQASENEQSDPSDLLVGTSAGALDADSALDLLKLFFPAYSPASLSKVYNAASGDLRRAFEELCLMEKEAGTATSSFSTAHKSSMKTSSARTFPAKGGNAAAATATIATKAQRSFKLEQSAFPTLPASPLAPHEADAAASAHPFSASAAPPSPAAVSVAPVDSIIVQAADTSEQQDSTSADQQPAAAAATARSEAGSSDSSSSTAAAAAPAAPVFVPAPAPPPLTMSFAERVKQAAVAAAAAADASKSGTPKSAATADGKPGAAAGKASKVAAAGAGVGARRTGAGPGSSAGGSAGGGAAASLRPSAVPWVPTGAAVSAQYEALRGEARDHARMRNVLFQQATLAYVHGNKALAKQLARQGRQHNDAMKQAHAAAAERTFAERNKHLCSASNSGSGVKSAAAGGASAVGLGPDGVPFIDLHGLHVSEAKAVLEKQLAAARSAGHPTLRVITGAGKHSRGGAAVKGGAAARLPTAVQATLLEHHATFRTLQPGVLEANL